MKLNYRTAFNALKKIGCPVIAGGHYDEDTFRISGENNTDMIWADYYEQGGSVDDFGVNHEVNEILMQNNLFAEWINPGILAVHDV